MIHWKIGNLGLVLIAVAVGAAGVNIAWGSDEVIGDQVGTTRVVLDNGLEVVVVASDQTGNEVSDVQVWLVVRAGSLNESDEQRGAAMVVERAIRLGTKNYSQEQINGLVMESAMGYGMRAGSFVSFDQSAFMVEFDRDDVHKMHEAFAFFGDVLGRDSVVLDDGRVSRAIGLVVDEINDEAIAELRVRQEWLPMLLRGTPFGDRLPRAKIEELEVLSGNAVRAFGHAMYHPGRAMVIVVGDVDSEVIAQGIGDAMGDIPRGERSSVVDGRTKIDVSMRAMLTSDDEFEQGQVGMIWFRDQGSQATEQWSDRARGYTHEQMRSLIVERVAGEIIRHRIGRLSVQELGIGTSTGFDQIDLWGQVDLMQLGIEREGLDWEASMRFLVEQCDRLTRDGATDDELARARRSLLARWHRGADDWVEQSNRERMGLVHWMVTTGRPVIGMMRWDRLATEMMGEIGDDEIDAAARALINPKQAAYIGLVNQLDEQAIDDGTDWHEALVIGVVEGALASPIAEIDADWMAGLSSSLMDDECAGGAVQEVSVHEQSGVWDVKLGNGVRVWAREMSDKQTSEQAGGQASEQASKQTHDGAGGRVYLTATVWGSVFDGGRVSSDEIDSALIAWRTPATEGRGHRAIAGFIDEHDLAISAKRDVGLVQLRVDGPIGAVDEAMELMYVLLDQPMIEREAFERWQAGHRSVEIDLVDAGLEMLYQKDGQACLAVDEMTLDSAQRVLTQFVRNGRIDIGIVGGMHTQTMIDRASVFFGSLVGRDIRSAGGLEECALGMDAVRASRVVRVEADDADEHGVVLGYVGPADQELVELRSLILSSMVLSDRLALLVDRKGFDGGIYATVAYTDATPGRMVFLIQARCAEGAFEDARMIMHEAIDSMTGMGIGGQEFAAKQVKIIESIAWYFDTPRYWSQRLAMLGVYGRRVGDLWEIRQGYSEIEPGRAGRVFEALIAGDEQFEIEIVRE